jgi:hypothetical protein
MRIVLAVVPLFFATTGCVGDCNESIEGSVRPSQIVRDVWTHLTIRTKAALFQDPFDSELNEIVINAHTQQPGASAASFVQGSERTPEQLRDVNVADARTIEFDFRILQSDPGHLSVINVLRGNVAFCQSRGTRVIVQVVDQAG